jgi:hypothetical protein
MDDAIEVKIQIVKFLSIRVGLRSVHGVFHAINIDGLFFDNGCDNLGIFPSEPSEKRWDTHLDSMAALEMGKQEEEACEKSSRSVSSHAPACGARMRKEWHKGREQQGLEATIENRLSVDGTC